MKKTIALLGLAGITASALASSEGNLSLCVYQSIQPTSPITYYVTQGASRGFDTEGNEGVRAISYPQKEGMEIGKIITTHKGLNCEMLALMKNGDYAPDNLGHFEINNHATSTLSINDHKGHSVSLNFGSGPSKQSIQVSASYPSTNLSLRNLQLSPGKGLSGKNMLPCPQGWCGNGRSPGSTSYIIWSPNGNMVPASEPK